VNLTLVNIEFRLVGARRIGSEIGLHSQHPEATFASRASARFFDPASLLLLTLHQRLHAIVEFPPVPPALPLRGAGKAALFINRAKW
jgi:hypothetical protein